MKYKQGMVAPINLFFMLFISRTLVVFTVSSSLLGGSYSADLIISLCIAAVAVLLLSVPIFIMLAQGKNLLENRFFSYLYALYFFFAGAIGLSRFVLFSSSKLGRAEYPLLLAAVVICAAAYAARLGIEAISRFGSMVFFIMFGGSVLAVILSFNDISSLNYFPLVQNGAEQIIGTAIFAITSTSEVMLLPVLAPKINGKIILPYCLCAAASLLSIVVTVLTVIGVLGSVATVAAHPLGMLYQIMKFASTERLDSLFTAYWIFAIFFKTALYLYASAQCIKTGSTQRDCIIGALGIFAATAIILKAGIITRGRTLASIIIFLLFSVALPLLYTAFSKRKNDIEKIISS